MAEFADSAVGNEGHDTATDFQVEATDGGFVSLPDGFSLSDATFETDGSDLLLTGADGAQVTVEDFFAQDNPPELVSADGAQISGDMATQLAGGLPEFGHDHPLVTVPFPEDRAQAVTGPNRMSHQLTLGLQDLDHEQHEAAEILEGLALDEPATARLVAQRLCSITAHNKPVTGVADRRRKPRRHLDAHLARTRALIPNQQELWAHTGRG